LLYAIGFAMPVYGRLLPLLIVLLLLNWIAEGRFIKNFPLVFKEKPRFLLFSFSFLYFLYLAGLIHTNNFQYAREDLETKLSILIFPLIFATSDIMKFRRNELILLSRSFVAGCLAGSLLLLGRACYYAFSLQQPGAFYYTHLSWSFHPGYYAMYLALACSILLSALVFGKGKPLKPPAILQLLILVFFTLMIILLSSKAGLMIWLAVLGIYSFMLAFKYRRLADSLKLLASGIAVFAVLLFIFPNVLTRVSEAQKEMAVTTPIGKQGQSTGERLAVWKASGKIIRENFLFGTGTGDVKDALLARYRADDLEEVLIKKLNAHNQYIQTFITLGVLGFVLLAMMFLLPAIPAFRSGNVIYFTFLSIVGISMIFESMFETQAGVVFYAFFNTVLFVSGQPDPAGDPDQVIL
jgi:O-antigen ligase